MQGLRAPRGSGDIDIDNRRVLVRADLCSPQGADSASQALLVDRLANTLRPLLEREARVIVAAHLDAPRSESTPTSLEEIGARLAQVLRCEIRLPDEVLGDGVTKLVNDTRASEVLLLENLARELGEVTGNPEFARQLASFCDAYINDAPYASRLGWASTTLVPMRLAANLRAAGDNLRPLLALAHALTNRSTNVVLSAQLPATTEAIALFSTLAPLLRARDEVQVIGPAATVLAHTLARPETTAYGRSLAQECKTLHARISAREATLITPTEVELIPERQNHLRVTHRLGEESPSAHHYGDVTPAARTRLLEGVSRSANAIYIDAMEVAASSESPSGAWILDAFDGKGLKFVAGMPALLALSRTSRGPVPVTCSDAHTACQVLAGVPLAAVQALLRDS